MDNERITETYDVLKTFIPKEDIYLNEPMSKHTTFKIGGNADIFVKLKSVDQIEKIIEITRFESRIPIEKKNRSAIEIYRKW